MDSVEFNIEIVTPMFLGGANTTDAELRVPSIKGMLRFWWRAMRAENDLGKLAQEEAKIFGGVGEGQGKSKLSISIKDYNKLLIGEDFLNEIGFKKNGKRMVKKENFGIGYLFYSTFTLRDKGKPILRKYLLPRQKYKLKLSGTTKDSLDNGLAALWLAIYFGGFGTRARRGAGNLAIINMDGSLTNIDEIKNIFIPNHKTSLTYFIKTGFSWAKEIIGQRTTDKYSNLANIKTFLGTGYSEKDWESALNNIGLIYKDYRTDIKSKLFKGPHYGIPVMHSGFKTRLVGYEGNKMLSDRRGSPLIIKLIKHNRTYIPFVIKLGGRLLPKDAYIMKENRIGNRWNATNDKRKEDQKEIDAFLDVLSKKGFAEVM
jgi:CRISPR-associated protein Cmr1